MGSAPASNLIERCRVTPAGHLEAWSIQDRYGVAILVVAAGLALLSHHNTRAGAMDAAVWVLWGATVFALLFGIAFSLLRETLRVDEAGLQLRARSVVRSRRWHAPRSALQRILLREVLEQDSEGSSIHYDLVLGLRIEDLEAELRIFRSRREPPARRMGAEVSRALGVPLVDDIGDKELEVGRSELSPSPPIGRLGDPPPRVRENRQAAQPSIRIQGTMRPRIATRFRLAGWGFFGLSSFVGAILSMVMTPGWLGWVIPFPFWGASLYFLGTAWAGERSVEHLAIAHGTLSREVELLGGRLRRAKIESHAVQRIRMQSESPSARGVALVSDEQILVVGSGLEHGPLEWLRGWLREGLRR